VAHPGHHALLVADLHLGKELVFRKSGLAIPEGATQETLERLDRLLEATSARNLWILGDLFHARSGLSEQLEQWLVAWRQRQEAITIELVAGNHDRGTRALCDRLAIGWQPEPWEVDGRRGVRVALAGLWPQVVTLLVGVPILGLSTGQWFGVAVAPPLPLGLEAIYALPDTWTRLLFLVNGTAMLVLLANLVPIPPLDAFVAVRSFASSRLGPDAGHRVAVKVGFVACGALAVAGIVAGMFSLLVFAGIGAWVCHTETRRGGIAAIRAVSGGDADPGDWWKRGKVEAPEPDPPEPAERREAAIRRERAAAEESEFDAILAKIKRSGLDSLTPAERKVLERETRRRRGEPG
jgi:hypothetical protein